METKFYECCPTCGTENCFTPNNTLIWKVCNECGQVIKPCTQCTTDSCTKCTLGQDRSVMIMESDTDAGMIDFGMRFGLKDYIKGVERHCATTGEEVPSDDELVKEWLETIGLTDGEYYLIGDDKDKYRVYPIVYNPIIVFKHPLGYMHIDLADTSIKCDYIVFNDDVNQDF